MNEAGGDPNIQESTSPAHSGAGGVGAGGACSSAPTAADDGGEARKWKPRRGDEARLRSIVEHMADGVVIVDRQGVIRFANPAAERLFGRSAAELQGHELGFPILTGDAAEVEVVRPQQQTVTAELRTVEMVWEERPAHLISLRDVTDRKRAAERAAQLDRERVARVEAEAASQAKSDFLALMSHELRTPLNAVIGYAELLHLGVGGSLTEQQREQVTRITASGHHLLGLVNEVLDLTKVEAGQLSLENGIGRSRDTVEGALALVQPLGEARGVTISVEPPEGGTVAYQGDENRVRQILVNLLNNAVKFTSAGGSISITWGGDATPEKGARLPGTGPWAYFRVIDTGIGIPDNKLAAIFDPFVQVEGGHARPKDGSGLGLAISRRLARLMRGDVTVQSELKKGSTFTLWLPDASAVVSTAEKWRAEQPDLAEKLHGLGEVGAALLGDIAPLLESFVGRLREEQIVDGAGEMLDWQLSAHLTAFVADVACTLGAIEEGRGEPSVVVSDAGQIQAVIAARHGMHRAQLGWTPNQLEKEWTILCEEMKARVKLHARRLRPEAIEEAFVVIDRMIDPASDASCRALNRVSRESTGELIRQQRRGKSPQRTGSLRGSTSS
jgi:signal transduction histidine kinase